jgi:hypothetical protein
MSIAQVGVVVVDAALDREMDQDVHPGESLDQRRLAYVDEPPRRLGDIASDRVDRDHFFHRGRRRELAHETLADAVCRAGDGDDGTAATRPAAPWANRRLFGTHRLPRTTTLDVMDVARRTHDRSCLFPVMEPILPEEQR